MPRPVFRIAVVLVLSVATLGGWGAGVAAMRQEVGCSHEGGVTASMAGHDAMALAGEASVVEARGAMAALAALAAIPGIEQDAPCCAPAEDVPPAPCSDDHGAMPCGTAQACATASALRPTVAAAPVESLAARTTPVSGPATRITGPVFAPDVPPPRGESPIWS